MSRSVIEIGRFKHHDGAEVLTIKLAAPPDVYPDAGESVALVCTPQDVQFLDLAGKQLTKDALRLAGKRVRESLDSQPAIQQAIKAAISQAKQAGGAFPIYFLLGEKTELVEPLPWETLWDTNEEFLALNQRWPIGRMSGGQLGEVTIRTFSPPIRMWAFLSATQIQAQSEWDELYDALASSGIPIHLKVYICEPALEQWIEQRPAVPNVTVEGAFLAAPFDFADLIPNADHTPHIIHFFCHGSTDDGPTLLLATTDAWENGESNIAIGPEEFARIPGMESPPWLVTLNCCEGGAPGQQTRSFARQLVTDRRIPAVVAMREAVPVEVANVFCGAFYRALLREIAPALQNGAGPIPIEWARALIDPRFAVVRENAPGQKVLSAAAGSKEWTLPVIYTRATEFKLQRTLNESEKKARLDILRRLILSLPKDLPPEATAELEQQVAALEAELLKV